MPRVKIYPRVQISLKKPHVVLFGVLRLTSHAHFPCAEVGNIHVGLAHKRRNLNLETRHVRRPALNSRRRRQEQRGISRPLFQP